TPICILGGGDGDPAAGSRRDPRFLPAVPVDCRGGKSFPHLSLPVGHSRRQGGFFFTPVFFFGRGKSLPLRNRRAVAGGPVGAPRRGIMAARERRFSGPGRLVFGGLPAASPASRFFGRKGSVRGGENPVASRSGSFCRPRRPLPLPPAVGCAAPGFGRGEGSSLS